MRPKKYSGSYQIIRIRPGPNPKVQPNKSEISELSLRSKFLPFTVLKTLQYIGRRLLCRVTFCGISSCLKRKFPVVFRTVNSLNMFFYPEITFEENTYFHKQPYIVQY